MIDGYSLRPFASDLTWSTTALLWFDFFLTFTTEVERIWRRKFTGATLCFLVLRYASLLQSLLDCIESFWSTSRDVPVRNSSSHLEIHTIDTSI